MRASSSWVWGPLAQPHAALFVVTNTNDAGAGSLRQAVLDANDSASDDTITFDATVLANPGHIAISEELPIANNGQLTITGPDSVLLSITNNTLNRVFNVEAGANLTINKLRFSTNNSAELFTPRDGGAILNNGTVTLNNSEFSGVTNQSGGNGGVIYNRGVLNINNSSFDHNTMRAFSSAPTEGANGGVVYNAAGGARLAIVGSTFTFNTASKSGGVISNNRGSTVRIARSTFTQNGCVGNGGVIDNRGDVAIAESTFSKNTAGADGVNGGAGSIYNSNDVTGSALNVQIRNSTFFRNSGYNRGGAIRNYSAVARGITLDIESCTFYQNASPSGGTIANEPNSTFILNNSIVVERNFHGSDPTIYGTVNAGDYNLLDTTYGTSFDGGTFPGTHNIIGQDPKLGILVNNGGTTATLMLLPGSPAIDVGKTTLSTDQRGTPLPIDLSGIANAAGSDGADIGAVEINELSQSGANFVVNTADAHSDGVCGPTDCTLYDAINAANNAPDSNAITFEIPLFAAKRTLDLTQPLPSIVSDMSINGPTSQGAGLTLRNASGDILRVEAGTVNIANLSFKDSPDYGLNISDGTVTVSACTFSQNGGGISNGVSTLTVSNSTFVGQIFAAIQNTTDRGKITLDSCTLTGNGAGVAGRDGAITVRNSLLAANTNNAVGVPIFSGVSIVTDTAAEAGLDPAGLKDNGGATPTIALVAGSYAINAGATTLVTDQRGQPRDGRPDIGAFENSAPAIVSLSPLNAADKVGSKRTFSLTVSDPNGASDIREVWLLINKDLSWGAGLTLIYVPSATSLNQGQLFLRQGDAFLPPLAVGSGSRAVLDNGVVSIAAREVTASVSGNSLTLNVPLTIRDGLVGQNQVFARVVDGVGATDPSAASGDNGYRRFGTYAVTPQFSGDSNIVPTLSKLTPGGTNTVLNSAGLGPVQKFSFYAADGNGIGDIESVWLLAGKERNWTRSATFIYTPRTRRLVLRSDDGTSFLGGGVVGTAGIIENSQVRVDLSQVRVLTNGDGKTLGIILPLQAKRGLLGQNKVWLRVQDNQSALASGSDDQGYVQSGTWNVVQGNSTGAPTALSAGNS